MLSSVQRVNLTEVVTDWSNVVSNDIDHHCDSFGVGSVNKRFKVVFASEVGVDLLPVSGPVAVVSWFQVVNNW
jgi:hypothetical protein